MSPSIKVAFPVKTRHAGPHEAVQASEPAEASRAPTQVADSRPATGPSNVARRLALAHHVESLVEAGVIDGYADAARQLGMTRAGMCHLTNLTLLAPDIQERILGGELNVPERRLRAVAKEPEWNGQARLVLTLPAGPAALPSELNENAIGGTGMA